MIALMIATSAESALLDKSFTPAADTACTDTLRAGVLFGRPAVLVRSGVGRRNAARAARILRGRYPDARVLLLGAAGAADPALRMGAVVLVENNRTPGGESLACDPDMLRQCAAGLAASNVPCQLGDCLTAARFVHSRQEKRHLFRQTGCRVIDMESAAAAAELAAAGMAVANLRVVSDCARRDTLDAGRIVSLQRSRGRAAVLRYFAARPAESLHAVRFLWAMVLVRRRLLVAVRAILCALPH